MGVPEGQQSAGPLCDASHTNPCIRYVVLYGGIGGFATLTFLIHGRKPVDTHCNIQIGERVFQ